MLEENTKPKDLKVWKIVLVVFLLASTSLLIAFFSTRKNLLVVACDVGQGDGILIQQGSNQMIIDGGPDSSILNCLERYMPFWDKEIEAVIVTHPEVDHFMGLINVFEAYKVDRIISSGLDVSTYEWKVLENLVGGQKTPISLVKEGSKFRLGLIYLDILYPDSTILLQGEALKDDAKDGDLGTFTSSLSPNEFAIVTKISFKKFDAVFLGDIETKISEKLAEKISKLGDFGIGDGVEYIKVPHHGSKNGITKNLLDVLNPLVAVISVGKDNSYGHPHKEIIDLLEGKKVQILRTDEIGDVVIKSDGERFWIK